MHRGICVGGSGCPSSASVTVPAEGAMVDVEVCFEAVASAHLALVSEAEPAAAGMTEEAFAHWPNLKAASGAYYNDAEGSSEPVTAPVSRRTARRPAPAVSAAPSGGLFAGLGQQTHLWGKISSAANVAVPEGTDDEDSEEEEDGQRFLHSADGVKLANT
jgi:hypothetical protein